MPEYHVLLTTEQGANTNVKTTVDNPTQAKTLALHKHPQATINGIMDFGAGEWVEPHSNDEPIDPQRLDEVAEQQATTAIQTGHGDEVAMLQKPFAPSITLAGIAAFVFLFSALFSAELPGEANAFFSSIEVTAFEVESSMLGMPVAYPLIGLYLIAILCAWFTQFNVVSLSLGYSGVMGALGASIALLIESWYQTVGFEVVEAFDTGFWAQAGFCIVFFIWGFIVHNRCQD